MKGADLLARGGALKFAHGVNSQARMEQFLKDAIDVFETDVSWGYIKGAPGQERAVAAHPPFRESDLAFEQLFEAAVASGKAVKIDIKDRGAESAVLDYLRKSDPPRDRFFLNADVVVGPGGFPTVFTPADARAWRDVLGPDLLVSIGWTSLGPNAAYTDDDVRRMLDAAEHIGDPLTICLDAHRVEVGRGALDAILAAGRHVSLWNWFPADAAMYERYRSMLTDAFIDLIDWSRNPIY